MVIPVMKSYQFIRLLPWYLVRWMFFSASFYFLVASLTNEGVPFHISFGYPLAGTLGLIAFFAPGGLGVRESILVGFFKLAGYEIAIATTISITSRLWYLFGEFFIFLLAIILNIHKKKNIFPFRVKQKNIG
jgi:uncharacterized membrane protein YbhN (UPF0104 family)